MAQRTETSRAEEGAPSPGTRAAAVVRGAGARAADLTEEMGRAEAAVLAGAVRTVTRLWGEAVGLAIDVVVGAAGPGRRRRARPVQAGAPRCIDLTDARSGEQIDEALSEGLAAAAPSPRTRAAG